MKQIMKRIGSLLLSVSMVITILPTAAFAEDDPRIDITDEFTDENFLNEVRRVLGKSDSDPIYNTDDFHEVTGLVITDKSITSLNGIEHFTNLTKLFCNNNQLTSFDTSELSSLEKLYLGNNQLTSLDVSGLSNLVVLGCDNNQLISLDVSGLSNLVVLDCGKNPLTSLDVSSLSNLSELYCENNQLTSLDVSGLSSLECLDCYDNQLTILNVSGLSNLLELDCNNNQLTSLNVSGLSNLSELDCSNNYMSGESAVIGLDKDLTKDFTFEPQKSGVDITAYFTDENFLAEVRSILGKGESDPIFTDDLSEVTKLYVINKNIASLAGIEYFTNLTFLSCNQNRLTNLDVSGLSKLTTLSCSYNKLTSLDVSSLKSLTKLYCGYNQLTNLDVSGLSSLSMLYCDNNNLTSFDISGLKSLSELYCTYNQLISLNASGLSNLSELYCYNNELTSLDVSSLSSLSSLNCSHNQLTNLDVSDLGSLTELECNSNQINSLDVSSLRSLTKLNCAFNQITNLNLSGLNSMTNLNCSSNQLTSLDVSDLSSLTTLNCSNNCISDESAVIGLDKDLTTNFTFEPQKSDNIYTITVQNDGNGTAYANVNSSMQGTEILLTAMPNSGYQFKEWLVISGGVTIIDNRFIMPAENVVIKAIMLAYVAQPYTLTADDVDFNATTGTITNYTGSEKDIIIPKTINGIAVTTIGEGAFSSNELINVVIPDGVTTIEKGAFSNNDGLFIKLQGIWNVTDSDTKITEQSTRNPVVGGSTRYSTESSYNFVLNITKDLEDSYKVTSGSAITLEIEGKGIDDLSYQWFSNSDRSYNGTKIDGATSNSYTIQGTTSSAVYYYVEVSVDNSSVTGSTTSSAILSSIAKINIIKKDDETIDPDDDNDDSYGITTKTTNDIIISHNGIEISLFSDEINCKLSKSDVEDAINNGGEIKVSSKDMMIIIPPNSMGLTIGDIIDINIGFTNETESMTRDIEESGYTIIDKLFKVEIKKNSSTINGFDGYMFVELDSDANSIMKYENGKLSPVPTYKLPNGKVRVAILENQILVQVSRESLNFIDTPNHWANNVIKAMASKGIINGKENCMFDPQGTMTRGEVATIMSNALGLYEKDNASFSDVSSNDWFNSSVNKVNGFGLMGGRTNGFEPNANLTRFEAITIIARTFDLVGINSSITDSQVNSILLEFNDYNNIPDWARKYVALCIKEGIINGKNGNIAGNDTITRAEITTIVYRLLVKSGLINK